MPSRLQQDIKQKRPFHSAGHETAISLLRTADLVRRHVGETLAPYDVTAAQYNVLRILRGAEPGGLCVNDIADRLIERNPGITRMIDRLVNHGWVRRERQEEDRRSVHCHLTPGGRRLVNRLDAPVAASDDDVVACLSNADTKRLLQLLERVREHLS